MIVIEIVTSTVWGGFPESVHTKINTFGDTTAGLRTDLETAAVGLVGVPDKTPALASSDKPKLAGSDGELLAKDQ